MNGRALSPSPIALFLLGLSERSADGSVEVGGRRVLLRKGQVVDIRPAEGDGDLVAFLRDSERVAREPLERCVERARLSGEPLAEVLTRQRLLSEQAVRDVTRGLWLDRLVRGMARASAEGREPAPLEAEVVLPGPSGSVSLVSLVLDALERRAADEDAGYVGARANHHLEWLPGPHFERAKRWAHFDTKHERPIVAELLTTEPAAAPRIAALVRAGLARIVSPDAPPAPPPPIASIPVTSVLGRHTPPLGSPTPRDTLPPPKRASLQLDPGLTPLFADDPDLDVDLPELPDVVGSLEDPLDALERTIAGLEQRDAPGPERAEAWRLFAEQWEMRFGSVEEAARAYREAAAANDTDPDALARASDRCAAIGESDLAVAYARASVSASPDGPARAAALWRHAILCRRLGKLSEALGAARAAATAAPEDPSPLALAVSLFQELGRREDAAQAALEAAARLRPKDPARALSLVAVAQGLDPSSPERAEAYARELADNGLVEAAIAVRADGVRRTEDPEARRMLLLAAAEQAELAERPALAASLLTRAFNADPQLDVLYEPLDADLAQAEDTLERAVLLEEIAASAPEDVRSEWLQRAAAARLELPGDGSWEAELRARALELDPEDEANLQFIRDQAAARDDDRLLADTLERALTRGRWSGARPQAQMLEELARLCEEMLGAPMRAAWAWERLAALDPDAPAPRRQLSRLQPALEEHAGRREQLERELLEHERRATQDDARLEAILRLADHLRDDPELRSRAVGLYREVLEVKPEETRAADAVERLYRLNGDEYHEAQTLALRADHAATPAERRRILLKLASLHVMRRDLREAAIASRRVLEETPGHREASLRLRRAASRLKDHELLREALAAEVGAALPPRQRARALTALARELEVAGSIDEAISCAEAALTNDPQSAEAALLVSRHLESVEQPRAALAMVRALFGDSPPILEAWARVARDSGEREVMREALDAWAHVAPYDPEPWAMRLTAFPTSESDEELAAAIAGALEPQRLIPRLAQPVARAIERLGERNPERAAELAVRASDALGPHGDALRELAGRLATSTGSYELRRAALERRAAAQIGDARVELLFELAELHQEAGDRSAEARTHLRILAASPGDARALGRLEHIYAETGEVDRLMAVLTLELEASEGASRLGPLLKLATASARLRGDLDRAESFLRDAWSPTFDSEAPLFSAATALVRLGRARRAVEHLRDAGRRLRESSRAAPVFLRAVQVALRKVGDSRLALSTAIEGLDHAPGSGGLLVAFEQLALELTDIDVAERTYRHLIDCSMGPHGRRALSYRRARWLEQAGAGRAALTAYLEAFEQHPEAGAVYSSIERLAREQGNLPALVKAAAVLGERASHPAIRASMAREAAGLLERELAAPEQAFEMLADLWERSGHTNLEDDLARLAGALLARSPAQGEAAFSRLVSVLRERADDAWTAEAKARFLLRVGRLHALGRRDLAAATAAVEEAVAIAKEAKEEAADGDLLADLYLELASWLWEASDHEAAEQRVRDALRAKPSHEGALALAAQLNLVMEDALRPSSLVSSDLPSSDISLRSPDTETTDRSANGTKIEARSGGVPAVDAPSVGFASPVGTIQPVADLPSVHGWFPAAPPDGTSHNIELPWISPAREEIENVASLEAEADAALARDDTARALRLLRAAVATDPARLSTFAKLADIANRAGDARTERIARGVLALIEPTIEPPEPLDPPPPTELSALLRDAPWSVNRALWRSLWQDALPLFRESLPPLNDNDRVTRVATTPVARAFGAALAALAWDELPLFYLDRTSEPKLELRRTTPPSLLGGAGFASDEASMRFQLGRMLEMSKPEHLLLATLPEEEAMTVVAAVEAAFGPAEEGRASFDRKAASLATELWRTIPVRSQAELRELLASTDRWNDYLGTRQAVWDSAARAGLIACGDLGAALRVLANDRLTDEAALITALRRPDLARLVRFALTKLTQ